MNQVVAYQLLACELAGYRTLSHDELVSLVGQSFTSRKRATDALEYEIDVTVRWSVHGQGKIVVIGMIGPVDWGSPLGRLDDYFIVSPPDAKESS